MKQLFAIRLTALFICCCELLPFSMKAQTATFSVSADTVCQDSCITLINTSTGHVDSIKWYIGGVTLSNAHSDTITACFLSAGVHSVYIFVYDSGRVDTATRIVTIKQKPHPIITYSTTTPYCWFSVPDIYSSYQWYVAGYSGPSVLSGATDSGLSFVFGPFFVIVDSNGCMGASDTVPGCPEGIRNIISTGPASIIYPNPVASYLTITASHPITMVSISNLFGQIVYKRQYSADNLQVDVADLPAGIYLVKINNTEVRKFLKE